MSANQDIEHCDGVDCHLFDRDRRCRCDCAGCIEASCGPQEPEVKPEPARVVAECWTCGPPSEMDVSGEECLCAYCGEVGLGMTNYDGGDLCGPCRIQLTSRCRSLGHDVRPVTVSR